MIESRILSLLIIIVMASLSLLFSETSAQDVVKQNNQNELPALTAENIPVKNVSPPTGAANEKVSWLSGRELVLSVGVLMFGVFVILLQTFTIRNRDFSANDIVKINGLSFVIVATLFIITAGYDSEQIAPAMGLFGTIAGYILGRNTKSAEKEE